MLSNKQVTICVFAYMIQKFTHWSIPLCLMLSNDNQMYQMYQISMKFIKEKCKQVCYPKIIQYTIKRCQICYQEILNMKEELIQHVLRRVGTCSGCHRCVQYTFHACQSLNRCNVTAGGAYWHHSDWLTFNICCSSSAESRPLALTGTAKSTC